eukprot:SAG31_NODE_17697_length_661_cov_0.567616_1_plen_137_part_10
MQMASSCALRLRLWFAPSRRSSLLYRSNLVCARLALPRGEGGNWHTCTNSIVPSSWQCRWREAPALPCSTCARSLACRKKNKKNRDAGSMGGIIGKVGVRSLSPSATHPGSGYAFALRRVPNLNSIKLVYPNRISNR